MKITLDDLPNIVLKQGNHCTPDSGMCLLEAAALFAGEPFSDAPMCVDPVIAEFGRSWNDGMRSNAEREQLKQYIPLIVGTAGSLELSEKRSWMAFDWLVRVHVPAWLALTPSLVSHAQALAALPEIASGVQADTARPRLAAAGDAARDAAWPAARDAAWAAARDAAWDAAWATRSQIEPTVRTLQASAHDLFTRMIQAT